MSRPSLAAQLASRAEHVAAIDAIDADLRARGIRVDAKPRARSREVALDLLAALAQEGPLSTVEIAAHTGQRAHACEAMCSRLTKAGDLRRVSKGVYTLAGTP